MSEELFPYYESELLFIRQLAEEFAHQYPRQARRLLLEPHRSTDPHVERLIEAFAFLTARVHRKLDDEFPELTDALLGVLYPHYLAPIPSMAIVQFELASGAQLPNGFRIERHSQLHTQPIGGLPCTFRTGYPVTLWPLAVTLARLQPPPFPANLQPPPHTAAALRLQFECQGQLNLADLSLETLRFYLSGDNQVIASLYELIFNHTLQVVFRPLEKGARVEPIVLAPEQCLSQVGFERDEGLLPYPNQSFLGYRLLTELFSFPSKFLFLDLGGWQRVRQPGFGRGVEVVLWLNQTQATLEPAVNKQTFRLGCTPVINLFKQSADPIELTQTRTEYRVVPDRANPKGKEIYSIDSVSSTDRTSGEKIEYQPFYSFRHGQTAAALSRAEDEKGEGAFWYAVRKESMSDSGTEVSLNLVDLSFDPQVPADAVLDVRTTCTNRNLPAELQRAGDELSLELLGQAPLGPIRCLRSPTAPLRPPLRRRGYWRLISHLCLNHLSISDPVEGLAALQEILRLYDFSAPGQQLAVANAQLIEGITSLSSRRVVGRTGTPTASGFCRGIEVTIEFDAQEFVGTGVFLFASVLERFLGLYASINSFSQLVARTTQGKGDLKKWRPRAGEMTLL